MAATEATSVWHGTCSTTDQEESHNPFDGYNDVFFKVDRKKTDEEMWSFTLFFSAE